MRGLRSLSYNVGIVYVLLSSVIANPLTTRRRRKPSKKAEETAPRENTAAEATLLWGCCACWICAGRHDSVTLRCAVANPTVNQIVNRPEFGGVHEKQYEDDTYVANKRATELQKEVLSIFVYRLSPLGRDRDTLVCLDCFKSMWSVKGYKCQNCQFRI
jgi:hypothetical protein